MVTRVWFGFLAVLFLVAACVPLPQSPALPVVSPSGPAPTTDGPTGTPPASPTALATPPAGETPAQRSADGWQSYTNASAGYSIRYPPNWSLTQSPQSTPEPTLRTDFLEGPEGTLQLEWGQGFGGACSAYSALHLAQGQILACYGVASDGTRHWSLSAVELPTTWFGGFAATKDAKPTSEDVVLAILATLTFDEPPNQAAPAATLEQTTEIIVDNTDAGFWPRGSWFFFDTDQKYGEDCYVALPGLQVAAEVRPELTEAGSYEVFARWCGDPYHDQTDSGIIEVHRMADDSAPGSVTVNYQASAGQWQSLGVYNLEPGAFLDVKSVLDGNVAADAFRFVYRSPAGTETPPMPLPTATVATTHNPPPPWQVLSSGDLAQRLDLTGPDIYASVPMTATQALFDDCEAFPRDGCGGSRQGWEAIVGYETITLTYRISDDYTLVAVEGADPWINPWLMGQDHPQRVFLRSDGGGVDFSVHYHPDNTWHLLRPGDGSAPDSDVLLTQEQTDTLRTLAPKYGSLYLQSPGGEGFVFYGLGPVVASSAADRDTLLALAAALATAPR